VQTQPGFKAAQYQRRQPEDTVLYQVVVGHLATFHAHIEADATRPGLPSHVRREFERYLRCGILAAGFCRVYCDDCRVSTVVAWSCKARAVCPSCTGRRMAEVGAHLADHVLPDVPIRQWVLSLPHKVRFLLVRNPKLACEVRGIFIRAVQSFYCRRARDHGIPSGRCGAVVYTQRFDAALRLDLHWHALVLDGVYTGFEHGESLAFHEAEPLRDDEIEGLTRHIAALITGHLSRRGLLDPDRGLHPEAGDELDTLGTCHAAAISGQIPFGPRAGQQTLRWGEDEVVDPVRKPRPSKRLCADCAGYSLHAGVRIGACNSARRERLCRYIARGPLAQDRLSLTRRGDVVYRFRKPWRNGKQSVVMDPLTFLARLAAQIPPPRWHVLSYYGVLGAAAARRDEIVPGRAAAEESEPIARRCKASVRAESQRPRPERLLWSDLLRRVFLTEILRCPCGGRRVVLSMVFKPTSIERVLRHQGLPFMPPERAPPRLVQAGLPLW